MENCKHLLLYPVKVLYTHLQQHGGYEIDILDTKKYKEDEFCTIQNSSPKYSISFFNLSLTKKRFILQYIFITLLHYLGLHQQTGYYKDLHRIRS